MSSPEQPRQRPLLLLADADELGRGLIAEALWSQGFVVEEAGDGNVALARAAAIRPDLILLGWMMPGLDGLDVCRRIRQDPGLADTPVLLLTGTNPASLDEVFDAGATDFAAKATEPGVLGHRLRFLLRATSGAEMLRRSEARLEEAQRIAQLGNWEWDTRTGAFLGSAEALRLLEAGASPLRTLDEVRMRVHPQEQELFHTLLRGVVESGERLDREFRVPRADGGFRFVHFRGHPLDRPGPEIRRVLGTVQDVTDRVQAEERIRTLAYYDALTGLANSRLFNEWYRETVLS